MRSYGPFTFPSRAQALGYVMTFVGTPLFLVGVNVGGALEWSTAGRVALWVLPVACAAANAKLLMAADREGTIGWGSWVAIFSSGNGAAWRAATDRLSAST
jgi:hypothetical protein